MAFSAADLNAVLAASIPAGARALVVAISGGADSAALLAALAAQRDELAWPLRAVHIDHGLQAAAPRLRAECVSLCERLQLPLAVVAVEVPIAAGASLEALARDARYAALAAELMTGECLLTAHHAEDQAETLLLQSLRGAGLAGLAGMPACREFGRGWHVRPLLETPQADLLALGRRVQAGGMLDPMNEDLRFDRNFLRRTLWPPLQARWPGAGAALSRTARHVAEAQGLLDEAAALDVARLRDGDALSVPGLRVLPGPRQRSAVRCWLREAGVEPPSAARLREALRQIFEAGADQSPMMVWGAHALRRYRGRVFLTAASPPKLCAELDWPLRLGARLELGPGLGALECVARKGGLDLSRCSTAAQVRARRGGEALRDAAASSTHSVQHLFQEYGVLPWMRDAVPMLFVGGELVAVADLWRDARWCVAANAPGAALVWRNAPIIL